MRRAPALASLSIALLIPILILVPSACENRAPSGEQSATAPVAEARKPMLWQRIHDATVVAVDENDADLQRRLAAATQQARNTLEDARRRWSIAKPAEQALWAVKWAAPLAPPTSSFPNPPAIPRGNVPAHAQSGEPASAVEHVWVRPINWSPFRIEGILLSQPLGTLDCGRGASEIVSLPSEEVSDWVHFASTADDAAFEGGFTLIVLEDGFGRPPVAVRDEPTSPATIPTAP
jgi:hypothetical protein